MKKVIALLLVLVLAASLVACDDGLKIKPLASNGYALAVKNDGTILAGDGYPEEIKEWTDIVEVAAESSLVAGLKKDGTVVLSGGYEKLKESQDHVKPSIDIANAVSGWTDIVAIAVAHEHITGLKKDGTIVFAARKNSYDESTFQCVCDWTDIVAISDGYEGPIVGVKKDGTVIAAGWDYDGRWDVSDWKDIIAVSVGRSHTVGLKKDGTVVAAGWNDYGECNVGSWTDITAVAAGYCYTLGLKKDGTVVAVGENDSGECNVGGWTDIVAISAGRDTLGVKRDGSVVSANEYEEESIINGWNLND